MQLLGVEYLLSLIERGGFSAKMVFNEHGAIFFPADQQHRETKSALVSYEDDYAGNALAAVLAPGRIEIRYHKHFSDDQIARIVRALLSDQKLAALRLWRVTYQGRTLQTSSV